MGRIQFSFPPVSEQASANDDVQQAVNEYVGTSSGAIANATVFTNNSGETRFVQAVFAGSMDAVFDYRVRIEADLDGDGVNEHVHHASAGGLPAIFEPALPVQDGGDIGAAVLQESGAAQDMEVSVIHRGGA